MKTKSIVVNSHLDIGNQVTDFKLDSNVQEAAEVKFWAVVDEWFRVIQFTAKPSTIRMKQNYIKKLHSYLPQDIYFKEVNRLCVTKILEDLYYNKNLSYSYYKGFKSLFSMIFTYAEGHGVCVNNFMSKIKIAKKRATLEERKMRKASYLEKSELYEILHYMYSQNRHYAQLIEFMALTGLRIGEALALQRKDYHESYIEVIGTYDQVERKKVTTKNMVSERRIFLSSRAINIINEIVHLHTKPNSYLFTNKGNKPISYSAINKFLHDIPYHKKINSHIFRHTHISILTELGIPLKAIMERVGHSEPRTTLSIYSHVTQKMSEDIITKLDTLDL